MGERVQAYLNDEDYDRVLAEHERTGKSKSEIVAEKTREGFQQSNPSVKESILPEFGKGLFIAGFVIAFYASLLSGLGVSVLGGALIVGSVMDYHLKNGATGYGEAFKRSIGI